MRNRTGTFVRTLTLGLLASLIATSCPAPIDDELLLVVADEIEPVVNIASPTQGSSYRYSLDVIGTLFDSSQEAGDGKGFVRTLKFAVLAEPTLDRTITFERDGSWTVIPADGTFVFTPGTGDFVFTVSTVDLSGPRIFTFTATDLNGNQTEREVTVLEEQGTGPDIEIYNPDPEMYSSDVTTSITIQGWVDLAYLEPGTTFYKVTPATGLPRSEMPYTPLPEGDPDEGKFSFTFNPQDVPKLAGTLTVQVWAEDSQGRNTEEIHCIYDDPGDPTGSFTIASGAAWTNDPDTTLDFNITDGISGMHEMRFKNESVPGGSDPWSPYVGGSLPWTLQPADGTRTVYAQFSDLAGNVVTMNDTIVLDTTPPSVSTFWINGGAAYTTARAVTLNISVSDGSGTGMNEMRFSDDGASWSTWEPYDTSKAWTLPDSDGNRTVYAQFTDAAGNTQSANDAIVLDRVGPTIDTFVINGDAPWTDDRDVTLTIVASDAGSGVLSGQMHFQNDSGSWSTPVGYASSTDWTLRNLDGDTRTVYVEVWDAAGNASAIEEDSIGLDRSDPNIQTFLINNGDTTTSSLDVTLTIAATDAPVGPYQMRFSNNDGVTWSGWVDYATSWAWTLAGPVGVEGSKAVDIQVNDRAGNFTQVDDGIYYSP